MVLAVAGSGQVGTSGGQQGSAAGLCASPNMCYRLRLCPLIQRACCVFAARRNEMVLGYEGGDWSTTQVRSCTTMHAPYHMSHSLSPSSHPLRMIRIPPFMSLLFLPPVSVQGDCEDGIRKFHETKGAGGPKGLQSDQHSIPCASLTVTARLNPPSETAGPGRRPRNMQAPLDRYAIHGCDMGDTSGGRLSVGGEW